MNKFFTSAGLSFRIWMLTSFLLSLEITVIVFRDSFQSLPGLIASFAVPLIGSIPALVVLLVAMPLIRRTGNNWKQRIVLLWVLIFFISAGYGMLFAVLDLHIFRNYLTSDRFMEDLLYCTAFVFAAAFSSVFIFLRLLSSYFSNGETNFDSALHAFSNLFSSTNTTITMDDQSMQAPVPAHSNRLMIKGLITGSLILLMSIPTFFIQNLIKEREERQKEVVQEVSEKWAAAQTLSGPFLTIPYTQTESDGKGGLITTKTQLIVSADKLEMNGKIIPVERPRSIYKVLLYRSQLSFTGSFKPQWPADIIPANLDAAHAKLCFSLSDFKGIEEEVMIRFNGQNLVPEPGLPVNDLGETGLSVPVNLSADSLAAGIPFSMNVKIKGSGQLHFIPMSVNSKYLLASSWPDPSFDGNALPSEREVKDSGFVSQWNFNRANSSFGAVVKTGNLPAASAAFGVSLVQPADQYNKTMRCVKYAILFIGLTFALFFIIEIMQKKPLHPVQYVLVGMALVIFYTLLLSISEFILFDNAYFISAAATVLLIMFYAKGHFKSWKSAGILGGLLAALYSFIFILIRLEDTALLVGSIGLFVILALVMYASRKINWYGTAPKNIQQ